jgi:poly(3-hydroxyalkanoate) synthetase
LEGEVEEKGFAVALLSRLDAIQQSIHMHKIVIVGGRAGGLECTAYLAFMLEKTGGAI